MEKKYTIDELIDIMKKLRAPDGCPWDRVQTHDSIKECMVEESYEVIDAIEKNDDKMMANELGDLLLQIVFHAEMAEERGVFDFSSVVNEICEKLISRHTHVFAKDTAENANEVLDLWEKNKKEEKGFLSATDTLKDVPKAFPALMRAQKVLKRAMKSDMEMGKEFNSPEDALDGILECVLQMKKDLSGGADTEENFKKMMLLSALFAQKTELQSEILLKKSVDEFIEKFEVLEQIAQQN